MGCCLQFVETSFELGNNYTDVIAPQDVATYGGLCALASFDRAELKVHFWSFSPFAHVEQLVGTILFYRAGSV